MEVCDLERRIFAALRTKDWLRVEDVATRAKVPTGTALMFVELFFREGHIVRRAAYPDYRYRANSASMNQKHRAHFAALMAATEPVEQA